MLQPAGIHTVEETLDIPAIHQKSGRSGCWHQQGHVPPLAGPQVSYTSSSRTARTVAGSEGIMPKVACATFDFLRPLPLPSLAGGMRISTSVPSGTGSGSWRMITSPFTCPLYPIVQFPLRGGQQPWSPRQTSGRLPTQVMYGFGTPCGRGPNHQHVLLIVVPAPFVFSQYTANPAVSRSRGLLS